MSFWVQHGHGKSDKLERIDDEGLLTGGVILSPNDEDLSAMQTTVRRLNERGISVLLDPQLYVYSVQGAVARCHESHQLAFPGLTWFLSPAEMQRQVQAVLDANSRLGIEDVIAPAPYVTSFNDVWTSLSLQYSSAFVQEAPNRAYLSVIAESSAFADWPTTTQWLDAVTTLDARGIYLVVGNSGRTYPFAWEPDRLANVLRVVYTLSELNAYEVLWGYSDVAGLAGIAAGAEGMATGWHHSLRMWSSQKWVPQSGGRQPKLRYFMGSLLSSIDISEAGSIARSRLGSDLFADAEDRVRFRNQPAEWTSVEAKHQHMVSLAQLSLELSDIEDVSDRLDFFQQLVSGAIATLGELAAAGVTMQRNHEASLQAMEQAIKLFREAERI